MLANFFGKSSPINFIIISGVFLVYFFGHYYLEYQVIPYTEIGVLIPVILVLFFFYNFILFKNKLTLFNSYGFLLFAILFGVFAIANFDRNTLLMHGLLLIFLRRVYSLRNATNNFGKLFDSGLWLGVFFIFEPFSALFGVLIYTANSLFQKTNWQTLLIPVVGFVSALICVFAYHFWLDQAMVFWSYFNWYTSYDFSVYSRLELLVPMAIFGSLTLVAFLFKTPKVAGISGSYRKYWTLVFLNLLVAVAFVVFLRNRTGAELQYVFFPVSIILANGLESVRSKLLKNVCIFLALVLPVLLLII